MSDSEYKRSWHPGTGSKKDFEKDSWLERNKHNEKVWGWLAKNCPPKEWTANGHTDLEWAYLEMPFGPS